MALPDLSPRPGDLEPIETASRDDIAALQLDRLKWTLRHAYENVGFYRRRFDEVGVHPDDLRDLSDLARFPFTTKQDLRDNYPFGMFAVPREQVDAELDVVRIPVSDHHVGHAPSMTHRAVPRDIAPAPRAGRRTSINVEVRNCDEE